MLSLCNSHLANIRPLVFTMYVLCSFYTIMPYTRDFLIAHLIPQNVINCLEWFENG